MPLTFADLVIVAVLVALGCVVTYVSMQRKLRRIVVELQQSSRQQLDALTQTLNAVEARVVGTQAAGRGDTHCRARRRTRGQGSGRAADFRESSGSSKARDARGSHSGNAGSNCGSHHRISGEEGPNPVSKNAAVAVRDCESVVATRTRIRASFS